MGRRLVFCGEMGMYRIFPFLAMDRRYSKKAGGSFQIINSGLSWNRTRIHDNLVCSYYSQLRATKKRTICINQCRRHTLRCPRTIISETPSDNLQEESHLLRQFRIALEILHRTIDDVRKPPGELYHNFASCLAPTISIPALRPGG